MRGFRAADGYAMLAALVIAAVAAAFALLVLTAAVGVGSVERSDEANRRAGARLREALDGVSDHARWCWAGGGGSIQSGSPSAGGDWWRAAWSQAPPAYDACWPRLAVGAEAGARSARARTEARLELRGEAWARGVVCVGDVEVQAPLTIAGSGLYAGGCLRGREHVSFAQSAGGPAAAGPAPDFVLGEAYPQAAAHTRGGIFAAGVEIHDQGGASEWPLDTDAHTGECAFGGLLEDPAATWLVAARAHAVDLGDALQDGRLDLSALDLGEIGAGMGRCILVPGADEVQIVGSLPEAVGPTLLVARGDATLGDGANTTSFTGAIVVLGHVAVSGDVRVTGSLHAGALTVEGPLSVTVAAGWRQVFVPGASRPVITERGG